MATSARGKRKAAHPPRLAMLLEAASMRMKNPGLPPDIALADYAAAVDKWEDAAARDSMMRLLRSLRGKSRETVAESDPDGCAHARLAGVADGTLLACVARLVTWSIGRPEYAQSLWEIIRALELDGNLDYCELALAQGPAQGENVGSDPMDISPDAGPSAGPDAGPGAGPDADHIAALAAGSG